MRNAPAIQNMAWLKNYTWDGVSHNLDERSLVPITTDFEMDSSIPEVISKLSADANYKKMFKSAFGDDQINGERILKALSQFMVTMVSADSKYDQVKNGKVSFTTEESQGKTFSKINVRVVIQANYLPMKVTETREYITIRSMMTADDIV